MHNKIFLEQYRNKRSSNTSEGMQVSLFGRRKVLPSGDLSEIVSAYDQYVKERGECTKIRLTCQVNPVCTNVLFNHVTEIVKDEGSSGVSCLNYGILGHYTEETLFDKVVYKPKTMAYWGGGSLSYQSRDSSLAGAGKSADLESYVNTPLYYDKQLTGAGHHPTNAIRDTQLSNDNFVYHCGKDILNNHLIRSNTFKTVCKIYNADTNYTAFNTIADLMRDVQGKKVVEKITFPTSAGIPENTKLVALHLYENDEIDTFDDSVETNLIQKFDGWVGFYNKSKIKSYDNFQDGKELQIDKPIMNMNGGDFVDMYPTRDLFSFVPKYNKFRNRLEKNWNYCVTYPSSSTTEGFEDIIETTSGLNSLKAVYYDENTFADNGSMQIVIYSKAKHGLNVGDRVNIYKTYNNENELVLGNSEVTAVADDFIFTVYNPGVKISDYWNAAVDSKGNLIQTITTYVDNKISTGETPSQTYTFHLNDDYQSYRRDGSEFQKYYIVNGKYVNCDDSSHSISYKKVVNGLECDYYVRIFSRMPNFRFASGITSNEYELYKDDATNIKVNQGLKHDFESHVSKLAFSKNAYSDDIGQVVFTDDIDFSYLKDNRGRPLTELFLTIVKNNKGWKEWYGADSSWRVTDIGNETVEYSHCFGKVTCAFELSDEANVDEIVSIKTINNLSNLVGYEVGKLNGRTDGSDLFEVDFENDINFYGDLACYDSYNAIESSIQPMLYRFNTAQRESLKLASNDYFKYMVHDELKYDDYDADGAYTVVSHVIDECNEKKEGYYYAPHYQIQVRTFGELQSATPMFLTIRSLVHESDDVVRITTLERHSLEIGDKAVLYDIKQDKYVTCVTVDGKKSSVRTFSCRFEDGYVIEDLFSNSPERENFRMFKIDNLEFPSYANLLKDGTFRYVWRYVYQNGLNADYDEQDVYPFTNGAIYINRKVDMYVRRQDPQGMYGLYSNDDILGIEPDVNSYDTYYNEEEITC